ncbi:MAG: hypothetical protein CMF58_04250 [Lentimicrobiaceae bacterium]|nr:hypothetical protein [Lentimicrobiaceae bacterium]
MKRVFKFLFRASVTLLLIGAILFGVLFGAVYFGVFGTLPSTEELSTIDNEEASLVLASDGTIIGKYFAENRTNVSWDDIPEQLINALVATEDKRFYLHEGYDGISYLRVFLKTILLGDKNSGGGSTLTQQLIKNLYGRNNHSYLSMPVNKIKEAIIASRMEGVLTKQQILLLYLNSVPFGENVYGVEAASLRFYGKHCKQLSTQEAAVLVGLLKANTYYNPRLYPKNALKRRNQVLVLMHKEGYLRESELTRLKNMPLNISYFNYQKDPPAGYFVYQLKNRVKKILDGLFLESYSEYDIEKDGLKIYTTLDMKLQKSAQKATKKQLSKMQIKLDNELRNSPLKKAYYKEEASKNTLSNEKIGRDVFSWSNKPQNITITDSLWHYYSMLNAAVLATEPESGKVLAWVGGNNYRYLPLDLVLTKRQIASTIKPLIYAAALNHNMTPCDYLGNELVEYKEYGGWTPQNYDNSSSNDTLISLWYSLANSLNLPTMDLYFKTGYEEISDMLKRFEINTPHTETPSVALGSIDVSLYDIVKAYGVFANNGNLTSDLTMVEKITDSKGNLIYKNMNHTNEKIINESISDQITHILKQAVNEGTGKPLRTRFGIDAELAGKTGTAQNYSNAWFVSYTPEIVLGVWVGAMTTDIHFKGGLGSGSSLALPIAGYIFSDIQNNVDMSRMYFEAFDHIYTKEEIISCDPFFEKGLSGVINRITNNLKESNKSIDKDEKNDKNKGRVRRFFDNLFKDNDK